VRNEAANGNLVPGEAPLVWGGAFPDDLDTTALALKLLPPPSTETVSSVLDTMAKCVNDDGTFLVSHQVNNADQALPLTSAIDIL
jgi:hypothetical protein